MRMFAVISVVALCAAAQCAAGQYQTAPAYGTQQQRKMAPSPNAATSNGNGAAMMNAGSRTYGANNQQQQTMASAYNAGMDMAGDSQSSSGDQYASQGASDMGNGESQQQYGRQSAGGASSYGGRQMGANRMQSQAANSYGNQQQQQQSAGGYGGKQQSSYGNEEPQHPPMPFAWGYDIDDGYGASQYHKENGDEYGKRTGSYGYRDAYGVFRYVDYVADENGFRATVKTNEPGTANEAPADVEWHAEQPPEKVFMGNKQSSSYGNGQSNGNSYASGQSSSGANSYAGQDAAATNNNYDSSMNGGPQSAGAGQYNANARQQAGSAMMAYGGSTSADLAGARNSGAQQQSYGAMLNAMMNSDAGRNYAGSSMAASTSGGAAMMKPAGARMQASAYGNSNSNGNGRSKTSRYNSAAEANNGNTRQMGASYGARQDMAMGMDQQQQQAGGYGPESSSDATAMLGQQYGAMGMQQQQQQGGDYGNAQAALGDHSAAMAGAGAYGSQMSGSRLMAGGQQQGYGRAMQEAAAGNMAMNNAKQYGQMNMSAARGGQQQQYGSAGKTNDASAMMNSSMDYQRAAVRNIGSLVKRSH